MKISCLTTSSAAIGIAAAASLLLAGCGGNDETADMADPAAGDPSALMGDASGTSETAPSGPPTKPVPYTVQTGDSLWKISRKFNVTMSAIANANNMAVSDTLIAGKTITIPVPEDAATTPTEPTTPTVPETSTPVTPPTPPTIPTPPSGTTTEPETTPPSRLVVPPEPSPSTPIPGSETPSTPTPPTETNDGFLPLGGN